MCQLCFAEFKTVRQTASFLLHQTAINSFEKHQDGYGVFGKGFQYKTEKTPILDLNFYRACKEVFTSKIGASHVRAATSFRSINIVAAEKSHPFISAKGTFVLAHNGFIREYEDFYTDLPENNYSIDTEVFVSALDRIHEEHKDFTVALKKTMELFYGKFAFIIYHTKENLFYLVRGLTATLFSVKIKTKGGILGTVINTERESLVKGIKIWSDMALLSGVIKEAVRMQETVDSIRLLKGETIFVWDSKKHSLIEKGVIKENKFVSTTTSLYEDEDWYSAPLYSRRNIVAKAWKDRLDNKDKEETVKNSPKEESSIISEFGLGEFTARVNKAVLTVGELNAICLIVFDSYLYNLSVENLEYLEEVILPDLVDVSQMGGRKKRGRKVFVYRRMIARTFSTQRYRILTMYDKDHLEMQFPWMYTPLKELRNFEVRSRKTYR